MLITIEGIDGSGKGTQTKLLFEKLRKKFKTVMFSFPSYENTFFGREVGAFLRGEYGTIDQVHPKIASILFAGDRYEKSKEIRKYLDEGYIVICDRYADSNIAHQVSKLPHGERESMMQWLDELEYEVMGIPRPDMTLFLDIPSNITTELVLKKEERTYTESKEDIHEADHDYLKETMELYRDLCDIRGWINIDCIDEETGQLKTIEEINKQLLKIILTFDKGE